MCFFRQALRALNSLRCVVVVGISICFCQAAGAQNLLVNGSFELPSMGATWVPNIEPTSWTVGNPGDGELYMPFGSLGTITLVPTDGTQTMFIDNTSIQQSVSLAASLSYSLSFDLSTEIGPASGANGVADLTITDGSENFAPSAFVVSSGSNSWSHETFDFTASDSDAYAVSLAAPAGDTTVLDNVVLVATTPEPTSLGVVGLLGVGLGIRKPRGLADK